MVLDLLLLIGAAVGVLAYASPGPDESSHIALSVFNFYSLGRHDRYTNLRTSQRAQYGRRGRRLYVQPFMMPSGRSDPNHAPTGDFGLRASAVLADAAVLAFTWNKTFRLKAEASEAGVKTSFASILMRDGTIYFLTLLVLNIVDMVVNRLFVGEFIYPLSTWIAVMTAILMCRFMLDLHEVESSLSGDSQARSVATLVFRDEMSAEEHDVVGRVYSIVGLGEGADEESNSGDNRADGDHLIADIEKTQTRNMVAPMCVPLPQD
ncbi:hypothetical protein A0H81_12103 [Grifola frondosa]|uniref:Uncharacterized protein n=1 Tax=Grifola frondosa TaxID=5627 RepID=A0A1C7LTF0_GRIFR|nr:hypothetical protein A0H81_12103 [Grifola frondosa]